MSGERHRALLEKLCETARETALATGVELVELSVRGSSRKRLVRCDIDRAGVEGVNLDDCQRFSRAFEERLDADDVVEGSYTLEVSSPGIDRPIVTDDDIRRNTGRSVLVQTRGAEGPVTVRGVLVGGDAATLRVQGEDGRHDIPRDAVELARQDVTF